jgi:predicted permease
MTPLDTVPPWPARWLHSLIVHGYPRSVRTRFGREMRQLFFDSYREFRRSPRVHTSTRFYARAFWDLAVNAVNAWLDSMRSAKATRTRKTFKHHNAQHRVTEQLGTLHNAVRYALRVVSKTPGFTFVVLLTLGLGIGTSTAIYSVVDGVLLAALPYPNADRLVVARERSPLPEGRPGWVSPLAFRDWQERTELFEDLVAWRLYLVTMTGGDSPERLQGHVVSVGYFRMMGGGMTLGRGFTADEDRVGGEKVVVISHGLWQRRFASDSTVIGTSMILDGVPHTIVGVAGKHIDYPEGGELWAPIALDYEREFRSFRYLGVLGRLADDVTLADAGADLERVAREIATEFPQSNGGWSAAIEPLQSQVVGNARPVLVGLMVAAAMLLLIAVGNVTNLFIARTVGRHTEVAVRRALGASRASLIHLFVAEALVLSILGGAVGVAAATWGTRILQVTARGRLPRVQEIGVDGHVLTFAVVVSLLVGVVVGVIPAFAAGRTRKGDAFRFDHRSAIGQKRANRLREVVLTVQVALAITLLVGASLLVESLRNLTRVDPGFSSDDVITMELDLPNSTYDSGRQIAFFNEVLNKIGAVPGVEAVGTIHPMPMVLGSTTIPFTISPAVGSAEAVMPAAHVRVVGPGYFETMRIPLLTGRYLESGDRDDTQPVAVISQTFADRFLGNVNPLGHRVSTDPEAEEESWFTIVGVVGDVKFRSLKDDGEPEVYTSVLQTSYGHTRLVVRTRGAPTQITPQVANIIHGLDPDLPVADVRTVEAIVTERLGPARLNTALVSVFATTAAFLALVGVLGVLTILVGRRMREIGIRVALGAQRQRVLRFVVILGLRPVVAGLLLGIVVSLGLTRLLASQLYGVSALDPWAYVVPSLAFLLTAGTVCRWPARRASRVDPASVLREE